MLVCLKTGENVRWCVQGRRKCVHEYAIKEEIGAGVCRQKERCAGICNSGGIATTRTLYAI